MVKNKQSRNGMLYSNWYSGVRRALIGFGLMSRGKDISDEEAYKLRQDLGEIPKNPLIDSFLRPTFLFGQPKSEDVTSQEEQRTYKREYNTGLDYLSVKKDSIFSSNFQERLLESIVSSQMPSSNYITLGHIDKEPSRKFPDFLELRNEEIISKKIYNLIGYDKKIYKNNYNIIDLKKVA